MRLSVLYQAQSTEMPIVICFKTCFESFSKEFSEYFPKNSSRKLHLEHTKHIIDGCRFGWVEIAFLDAIISCCLNYDLKVGKRNFHQHIALVKAMQSAIVKDSNPHEYPSLCKYHNVTHDIWLINILSGFESAKALYDHVIAGKDNSRAEKKTKNLTQFFAIITRLPIFQDASIFLSKSSSLDELAIALDKRPASRYLCALSLALKNASNRVPQLEMVKQSHAIKQIAKEKKDNISAEVKSSVLMLQQAATAVETSRDDSSNPGKSASTNSTSINTLSNDNTTSVGNTAQIGQNDSLNYPVYIDKYFSHGQEDSISDYAAALVSMSQRNGGESEVSRKRPFHLNRAAGIGSPYFNKDSKKTYKRIRTGEIK